MFCGQCFGIILFIFLLCYGAITAVPQFRILAPQFVCPKDENTPVAKLDNTVITLQTAAGADFPVWWTVRWSPLPAPTQRRTIMLWRAVRALEARLNTAPKDPYVYVIENDELLTGVDYIFNVSAIQEDGTLTSPKSFHIDNTYGDQKLDMIEGRADLLSIVIVGGTETYADVEYVLDAQITACFPTQDYYFVWTIRSVDGQEQVDVSGIRGNRLQVAPFLLKPGLDYDAKCEVIKQSTGLRITQTGLPFQVLQRGLEVYLNVDYLIVPANKDFFLQALVINHDYLEPVTFIWECQSEETCNFDNSDVNDTLTFPNGLSLGQYEISVIVSAREHTAKATATIVVVGNSLPVIQIAPLHRIINEGSKISLVANASNVSPTCTLTWFFSIDEYLPLNISANFSCDNCEHGEPITDTVTIFSLEENFLNELTDFTNKTEWRQVSAEMTAASGRARFVAECGCSMTFECDAKGIVYADIDLRVNESPKPGEVNIAPDTGVALETIFRISTLSVVDPDSPLRYSFFCSIGTNDSLLLGSFTEHLAVETFLPYIDGGIELWVEVCDVLGACSKGPNRVIELSPGEGATVETFLNDVRGHLSRCELTNFNIDVMSAVLSYMNANQSEILTKFVSSLLEILETITDDCLNMKHEQYSKIVEWLAEQGVDTTGLKQ